MRPTPLTDAAIAQASDPDGAKEVCDLCEALERQLDEAREVVGRIHREAVQLLRTSTNSMDPQWVRDEIEKTLGHPALMFRGTPNPE